MDLNDQRESDNVEDRRSGGGFSIGGGGLSIGTVVVALVISAVFGVNPLQVLHILDSAPPIAVHAPASQRQAPVNDAQAIFVRKVLASTEDVWQTEFQKNGKQYPYPTLVLFRGSTPTACGTGQAAMGPFYCPGDQKVYIDLAFYDQLRTQLGSPGDFAQAYVIAHEVGHHVQNVLGITRKIDALRGKISEVKQNALSVRLELQADCFAGVWAYKANAAKKVLQSGDVEEALNAASHIGDDALQRAARGVVVPESFTHGTSEQRVTWFKRGLEGGYLNACNTFKVHAL